MTEQLAALRRRLRTREDADALAVLGLTAPR